MPLLPVPDTRRPAAARPPRWSHRLPVAVLVTVALLTTALVGSAGAGAAVRDDLSATCRGLTDTSFRDVADQPPAAREAIGCLASYEITSGVAFNQYGPRASVSRQQMVLFLSRQFDHVVRHSGGLVQYPSAIPPAPLSDRPRLSREVRAAVDLMYALDVTTGTASGTFAANDVVTRAQMALFISRLQDAYADGLGESARYASAGGSGFTDLPADPRVREAVYSLQDAGVVQGTGPGRYSPSAPVSRVQMALFLMRHLDENVATGRVGGIGGLLRIDDGVVVARQTTSLSIESAGHVRRVFFENRTAGLTDAVLVVDGAPATLAQFESEAGPGDTVDVVLYPTTFRDGGGFAQRIELTNRIVETGFVRNFDLTTVFNANAFLATPTGATTRTIRWQRVDGVRFTVDGRVVSQDDFGAQFNVGDVLDLQDRRPDDVSWGTLALTNRPFTGVLTGVSQPSGAVALTVSGRGAYVGSSPYRVNEGASSQVLTVDGRPATFEDVEAQVEVGDLVTIDRRDGVTTFAFTNRG